MDWVPPWNCSSFARSFREADGYVVSVPKSGRTWLHVFLGAYEAARARHSGVTGPKVKFTHDLWDHYTKASGYEQFRGKRLIPRPDRHGKKVVLMLRDPRDLLVSLYFHLTKRTGEFSGTPAELIRDHTYGIEQVVRVWNHWLGEWGSGTPLHILRYEEARKDPVPAFTAMLEFLGPGPVDPALLVQSIELSSFQNMKKMEVTGDLTAAEAAGVDRQALTPGAAQDPNSFKVRSGKVGGYTEHFNADDLAFISQALQSLDPRAGYSTEPQGARVPGTFG